MALVDDDRTLTYAELHQRIAGVAESMGSTKSLVMIAADNSLETVVALYGALYGGHTAILCPRHNGAQSSAIRQQFQPQWICDRSESHVWQLNANKEAEVASLHPDLALVVNQAGDSDRYARFSYQHLAANSAAIGKHLQIGGGDKTLLTLPLHSCYGLTVLNSHLASGATVHLGSEPLAGDAAIKFIQQAGITSLTCAADDIEQLEAHQFREHPLPSLRYLTLAGGGLEPEASNRYAQWAGRANKRFFVMAGQNDRGSPGLWGSTANGVAANDAPTAEQNGSLIVAGAELMMGYARSLADLAEGTHHGQVADKEVGSFAIVERTEPARRMPAAYAASFSDSHGLGSLKRRLQRSLAWISPRSNRARE
nr:AMP-binding protein [Halioxenophilus sp. WMMB6]